MSAARALGDVARRSAKEPDTEQAPRRELVCRLEQIPHELLVPGHRLPRQTRTSEPWRWSLVAVL